MNRTNQYIIYLLLFGLFLTLSCKKEKTKSKVEDEKQLQQLMLQITTLAETSKCGDNTEIFTVTVGEKACGGAKIYIPYTNSIDVDQLKNLTTKYTSLEKAYNKKWNIVSDCALTLPPKSITCQSGKLVVEYWNK